ncbi:GNAT family N-acetyltransferase [Pseudoalteromonas prydzensis]|uniref:Acetyltransferase n=1 Tax=Pseudoalteromonas prydzensis TaxID=182141 RepID=A0ABR9FJN8_9GAMM|nr:GNAT family N-acetyltransferase [Pseudoalteromonas prydzensis]MBE0457043.1 acetyltransferase [Pseudoalteromonas prydzensis]
MLKIHHLWKQFPCSEKRSLQGTELAAHYNQYCGQNIRFKLISKNDLDMFCRWMRDPRVEKFWQQAWSEEKQWRYLTSRLEDNFTLPLIVYFDNKPFAYVEVYWSELDSISQYYQHKAADRGIHLLVGEQSSRGPENFRAWMCSLSHLIYSGHEQTSRIVLEPRHDNTRLLSRINEVGYQSLFEFDFPHKRAALVLGEKNLFYTSIFPKFG